MEPYTNRPKLPEARLPPAGGGPEIEVYDDTIEISYNDEPAPEIISRSAVASTKAYWRLYRFATNGVLGTLLWLCALVVLTALLSGDYSVGSYPEPLIFLIRVAAFAALGWWGWTQLRQAYYACKLKLTYEAGGSKSLPVNFAPNDEGLTKFRRDLLPESNRQTNRNSRP